MLPGASFQKYVGGFLSRSSWTTHIESHNRWKGTLRTFEWPRWFHCIDMWICCVCLGGSCISLFHSCFYFHIHSVAFFPPTKNVITEFLLVSIEQPRHFVIKKKPGFPSGFLVPSSTSIETVRPSCVIHAECFGSLFRSALRIFESQVHSQGSHETYQTKDWKMVPTPLESSETQAICGTSAILCHETVDSFHYFRWWRKNGRFFQGQDMTENRIGLDCCYRVDE